MDILELKGPFTGNVTRLWAHLECSDSAASVLLVGPKFTLFSSAENLSKPHSLPWKWILVL